MKKFIIVIVFVFLISILISFNYLLWDREKQLESFQGISDSKNLTIDTLSEKMNNLDKQNKELTKEVEDLSTENAELKNNNYQLTNENANLKQNDSQKNDVIAVLKKTMDATPINALLKKWVEAINAKNYNDAYNLVSKDSQNTILNDADKLKETYQQEIKAIKIKSSEPYTGLIDDEHIAKIQFKVVFEADKPENAKSQFFKSGENEKYFTLEYDTNSNTWKILDLADKP